MMITSAMTAPAQVGQYLEELLDVLWAAVELARSGRLDLQVADAIRSANEVLDVMQAGMVASPSDIAAIDEARDRVNAAGALFMP